MALNLPQTVVDILKSHSEQYVTARELAEEIYKEKKEECLEKMNRSKATIIPINDIPALLNQLVAEIGAYKKRFQEISSNIKMTAERPRKYCYSEKTDEERIEAAEKKTKQNGHPEHDSYPFLCEYLHDELNIFPKRINEKNLQIAMGKMVIYGCILIS